MKITHTGLSETSHLITFSSYLFLINPTLDTNVITNYDNAYTVENDNPFTIANDNNSLLDEKQSTTYFVSPNDVCTKNGMAALHEDCQYAQNPAEMVPAIDTNDTNDTNDTTVATDINETKDTTVITDINDNMEMNVNNPSIVNNIIGHSKAHENMPRNGKIDSLDNQWLRSNVNSFLSNNSYSMDNKSSPIHNNGQRIGSVETSKVSQHEPRVLPIPKHILANISAVLISNSESFIHLSHFIPHLPDECVIITTRPIYEFGILLLKQYDQWNQTQYLNELELLIGHVPMDINSRDLHTQIYPTKHNCRKLERFLRVICLSYREPYQIHQSLSIQCVSSGFSIGTPNFLVQDVNLDLKFVYISHTNVVQNRYSANIDFSTFYHSDVVLLDSVSLAHEDQICVGQNNILTYQNQGSHQYMCEQFSKTIGLTLSNGGDIYIPCKVPGIIIDLLEVVHTYITSIGVQVNIYIVSPMALALLKYANIFSEFLSETRQNKALFSNEQPFEFESLLTSNQLMIFSSVSTEFAKMYHTKRSTPSIIFSIGDPRLESKDSKSIIQILQRKNGSIVQFIESDYDPDVIISPYLKLYPKLKYEFTPFDLRLNIDSATSLLKTIQPKYVVCKKEICNAVTNYFMNQIKIREEVAQFIFIPYQNKKATFTSLTHSISLKRKYKVAQLDFGTSEEIFPKTTGDYKISQISGTLHVKDGKSSLSLSKKRRNGNLNHSLYLFGILNPEKLLQSIHEQGIECFITKKGAMKASQMGNYRIELADQQAFIELSLQETRIECCNEKTRLLLRDIIKTHFFNF